MATSGILKVTCSNKQDLNLTFSNNLNIDIQGESNQSTKNGKTLALRSKSYDIMKALAGLDGDAGTLSIKDAKQAHVLKGQFEIENVTFDSKLSTLTIGRKDGVKITLDFESDMERAKNNPTPEEARKTEYYTNELRGKYYTDGLVFQKARYKVYTYTNGTLYVELLNDINSEDILEDFDCRNLRISKEKYKKGDIISIPNIDQRTIRDNRTIPDKIIEGILNFINDHKTTKGEI